jgi:hypothetical protein
VPAPSARGMLGKARAVANRAFAETIPVEADGHGNGHAVTGQEHEAVGAPGSTAPPAWRAWRGITPRRYAVRRARPSG